MASPTCSRGRGRTGPASTGLALRRRRRWVGPVPCVRCAPTPAPLVPPELRFAASERTGPDGEIEPLADGEADRIAAAVGESGAESVAICLLFSYLDPAHEQALAERLRSELADVHVSASSDVLPQFREYERASTTVIDAYLSPLLGRYLERLQESGKELGLPDPLIMKSS